MTVTALRLMLHRPDHRDGKHLFQLSKRAVNRAAVERYLGWLLKQVQKTYPDSFTYPHPDGAMIGGKPHMAKVVPVIELQGHPSEEFRQEIAAGRLSGIRLVSKEKKHLGTGETPRVRPVLSELKLEPIKSWREEPLETLKDAMKLGRKADYEAARISFAGSDGVGHSCLIDTGAGNVRGEGFVKKNKASESGCRI